MLSYTDVVHLSKSFELRCSKHIAVLVQGADILDVFTNRYACHAEELALWHYRQRFRHCTRNVKLFVVRVSDGNKFSRPCRDCCKLMTKFPHIRVFYSGTDGEWREELNYDSSHVSQRRLQLKICRQCVPLKPGRD